MRKFVLLVNTLRYLKWQQVYFRLQRKLVKAKVTEKFHGIEPRRSEAWEHLTLYDDKIDHQLEVFFLNYAKKLELPLDWNNQSLSKLWVYNLHYFEDLLSESAPKKKEIHQQLLNNWINENPVGFGNGWEPYPCLLYTSPSPRDRG